MSPSDETDLEQDRSAEAYALALRLLKGKDRFEGEIRERLEAGGFEEATVESILERLRAKGLVNDVKLAHRLASTSKVGHALLIDKLKAKGASEEALTAVESLPSPLAIDALSKFDPLDLKSRARAGRYLASKGFDEDEIESALNLFFTADPAPEAG